MNLVLICGRATSDPKITYTQGQNPMAIARMNVAVDRKYKKEGQPTADFIGCVAFSKTAEFIEKYIKKGTKVIIEGSWQTGSYEKNGTKVYTNECVINSIEFAESKKTEDRQPTEKEQDNQEWLDVPDNLSDELPWDV